MSTNRITLEEYVIKARQKHGDKLEIKHMANCIIKQYKEK